MKKYIALSLSAFLLCNYSVAHAKKWCYDWDVTISRPALVKGGFEKTTTRVNGVESCKAATISIVGSQKYSTTRKECKEIKGTKAECSTSQFK